MKKKIKWILIGEVVGSWGNRGEIKVIAHTEFPERFSEMASIRLFKAGDDEPCSEYELTGSREHKGAILLKLAGVDTIGQAEKFKNALIKVSVDELRPLPPGRFYIFQLIGLECVTVEGLKLGVLTEVLQTGANDVYILKPFPGVTKLREILIPVLDDVVLEIDPEQGRILVDLPQGLLD